MRGRIGQTTHAGNPCPTVHHRRSIRLKGYDYAQTGAYFITLCTHNRLPLFGEIVNGEMQLNEYGRIAHEQWQQIPARFEQIELSAFVIMPNHIHGIIIIPDPVGAGLAPAQNDEAPSRGVGANTGLGASPTPTNIQTGQPQGLPRRKTVGDIVGAYKSLVANECLKIFKTRNETMGKIWQRNYYEHIIRDETAYMKIAQYILDNPAKYELDSLHPGGKG